MHIYKLGGVYEVSCANYFNQNLSYCIKWLVWSWRPVTLQTLQSKFDSYTSLKKRFKISLAIKNSFRILNHNKKIIEILR